jgi:hypothetical protein
VEASMQRFLAIYVGSDAALEIMECLPLPAQ